MKINNKTKINTYNAGTCDIAVIGAGHAGIEASLAAARLGMDVICFAINLDSVGNLPCNPAIGGTGKGHLVRELDALGGQMAKIADEACIQYRMLNRGKGPAVYSLRAQADRRIYQSVSKHCLELQSGLRLKQAEITEIIIEDNKVAGVVTETGAIYSCQAAIVATGTYLDGSIIIGDMQKDSGPDGLASAKQLCAGLRNLGLNIRRFKTGTPPRINARTVDFSQMTEQPGDTHPEAFSFDTDWELINSATCYLTHTNEKTHAILKDNLDRSPIYSGVIEGVGPRYCPSIETKIMVFPDKNRHQVFIEPMGLDTEELYVQGFSSSMPQEVQEEALHTIVGLEKAEITRPGYAIEYDCIDPLELYPTLETKKISGLYGAGQFNGSSGYEEAAVQGFVAGVNAARKIKGQDSFVLRRSDGYIGTLIDDLVTKGTQEPYRMMTSRSEYRLLHRQDNADERLTEKGYELGLKTQADLNAVRKKYEAVDTELKRLDSTYIGPSAELTEILNRLNTPMPKSGISLSDLLRRPEINYDDLKPLDKERPNLSRDIINQVEIRLRYDGYIKRQLKQVQEFSKMENRRIPQDIDFKKIPGIRTEAAEKLSDIRPENFGRAARISGVSPSDMTALMIYCERQVRG
ncbi:MAG: tRNA uridine-5-carboxymethylaminomethyl(34) synthesis enzyme MnmG [Ruminococcaceae bacterium]|nr:tRNA uridine-5-carboxymethylaminomethyl(34) synthesis enzyme MnmG [Oscillospiraceae bacterium]NLC73334.1 tRNA uridine-5-carboxymethylaminomethyl(34) synthesis enzyme MnmG [Oscillospiraceae bacterium]